MQSFGFNLNNSTFSCSLKADSNDKKSIYFCKKTLENFSNTQDSSPSKYFSWKSSANLWALNDNLPCPPGAKKGKTYYCETKPINGSCPDGTVSGTERSTNEKVCALQCPKGTIFDDKSTFCQWDGKSSDNNIEWLYKSKSNQLQTPAQDTIQGMCSPSMKLSNNQCVTDPSFAFKIDENTCAPAAMYNGTWLKNNTFSNGICYNKRALKDGCLLTEQGQGAGSANPVNGVAQQICVVKCVTGTSWNGTTCVATPSCPSGTIWNGSACNI